MMPQAAQLPPARSCPARKYLKPWKLGDLQAPFADHACLHAGILGGVAHLLSFEGTDTLSAAYYAQVSSADPLPLAS